MEPLNAKSFLALAKEHLGFSGLNFSNCFGSFFFSSFLAFGSFFGFNGEQFIIYSTLEMEGGINQIKEYPLSDTDIRTMLGNDIKIITYPQLGRMRSIDEAFDRKGRSMILFLTEDQNTGHWICMIRKPTQIEFFDPYGDAPDEQKDALTPSKLQQLDQDRPYLTKLLRASGKKITYNKVPFQQDKAGVNTCGRWCVARLLYAPKSLRYFYNVVQSSDMKGDDFVSGLTAGAIGK